MNVVLVGGSCDGRRLTWPQRGNPVIRVSSLPRMAQYSSYADPGSQLVEVGHIQHEEYRIVACYGGEWAVAIPAQWDMDCGLRELVRGYHEERQHCD